MREPRSRRNDPTALRGLALSALCVVGCDRSCLKPPRATPSRRGTLTPPARAPTLIEHLAVCPPEPNGPRRPAGTAFVAQISDADARFASAPPVALGGDAALLCRFSALRDVWDGILPGAAPPDLRMQLQIAHGPLVQVMGPEDRVWAYVTLPVTPLVAGLSIMAQAWDVDVGSEEFVGRVEGVLPATTPWVAQSAMLRVECRAVSREGAESALAAPLRSLDAALTGAEDAPLSAALARFAEDPNAPVFRVPLDAVAGWVGWADPRVVERSARGDRAIARWDAAGGANRQRLRASLPAPGTAVTTTDGAWDVTVRGAAFSEAEVRALDAEAPSGANRAVVFELVSRRASAFVPDALTSGRIVGADGSTVFVSSPVQQGVFVQSVGQHVRWVMHGTEVDAARVTTFTPAFVLVPEVPGGALRLR